MSSRRLILLRHGQTGYNATMRMQGQLDTELSPTGVAQARAVAGVIAARRPLRIVSSDLRRAKDTAAAVAAACGLEVTTDPRLRETDLGRWQDKTHLEVDAEWPGLRAHWRTDASWAPPGGESRLDVARRALPVVRELFESVPEWGGRGDRPIVLVAHGGLISGLTAGLLELPTAYFPLFNGLGNTSWAQLTARPRVGSDEAENGLGAGLHTWCLDVWNASANVGHDVL